MYSSLVTRLEKYNDTEVAAVTAEKARYDKLKAALDTARSEYLALRKGADAEQRLRAARSLDDARAAARLQRGLLAKAAAAAAATQGALLLDAAADVADAYGAFLRAAAASAPQFEAAAAALRSSAGEARSSGEALITAAAAAAAAHTSAAEPGGSAVAAEMAETGDGSQASRGGTTGQNLGRSHDADIRRLLASGPGHVIKRGYLNKQARSLMGGWRRRWFVLDSSGTLTYMNEQQLVTAAVKNTTKHGAGPLSGGTPALGESAPATAAPEPAVSSQPAAATGGFGGKAMAFLQKRMDDRTAAGGAPGGGASSSTGAPPAGGGGGGDDDDDEAPLANRTVNLQVSTVKLDGDPNDRSRDLRFCFRLISPNGSMVLQADSAAERDAWMASLQGVIAELLTSGAARPQPPPPPPPGTPQSGNPVRDANGLLSPSGTLGSRHVSNSASLAAAAASGLSGSAIAARLSKGPGNGACADCGAPDPDWASLNCGVLICQNCAGAHRGLGTHVSKVRSIALDAASWSRPLLAIFESHGNDLAARAWGVGAVTTPTATPAERGAAIRSKYEARIHVPGPRKAQVASQPGMVDSAAANCDVARMFAVLVAGGKPGVEALHGACAKGEAGAQACCMLLVWGADPTAKRASDGATPEQVALQAGCSADSGDVVPILRAAAAKQAA